MAFTSMQTWNLYWLFATITYFIALLETCTPICLGWLERNCWSYQNPARRHKTPNDFLNTETLKMFKGLKVSPFFLSFFFCYSRDNYCIIAKGEKKANYEYWLSCQTCGMESFCFRTGAAFATEAVQTIQGGNMDLVINNY